MSTGQNRFNATLDYILEWWWLYFIAITPFVITQTFAVTLLALGCLFFPLHWWKSGYLFPAAPIKIPLHILTLSVMMSIWVTFDLAISAQSILATLHGITLFWALLYGMSSTSLNYASALIILATGQTALALVSLISAPWTPPHPVLTQLITPLATIRAMLPSQIIELTRFNPNRIAGTLLWFTPTAAIISLMIFKYPRQLAAQNKTLFYLLSPILLLITPLLLFTLLLTNSRGAYLGILIAIPIAITQLSFPHHTRNLIRLIGGSVITGAIAIALSPQLQTSISNNLLTNESGSLTTRLELWSRTIGAIQDFPLTGIGFNTFPQVIHTLYPLFLISPTKIEIHAHNELLSTTVELGIFAGIAYFAISILTFVILYKNEEKSQPAVVSALNTALSCSFIAFTIFGLTDSLAIGGRTSFLFWMLLAAIFALHNHISGTNRQ